MHRYTVGGTASGRRLAAVPGWFDAALRSSVVLVVLTTIAMPRAAHAVPEGRGCDAEPTDMPIEYGDLINCAIEPVADIDIFRFTGGSGETVRIQISGRGFSGRVPCFELFDPGALPVESLVCANDGADYVLDQTGAYTILITDFGNNQTVDYSLLVERIVPLSLTSVPIEPNQVTQDDIDIGDLDVLFLSGSSGDTIRVQISGRGFSGRVPCFELFDPGAVSVEGLVCADGGADYVLNQTGIYTVLVGDFGNDQSVAYSLSHACILGTCADGGVRPLQASGCLVVKGVPLTNRRVRLTQPNESPQTTRTDVRGCFAFDVVRGKPYEVEVAGPDVPE